jgi:LCP family protein required for cell wall assembly
MSRYDDVDDAGGHLTPWGEGADPVDYGRRGHRTRRQDAGGRNPRRQDTGGGKGRQPDGEGTGRQRGPRKEVVLGAAAILATVIVVSTSLVAYARYRTVYGSIKRVDVTSGELGKHRPPYTAALNILVIGSDSRAGTGGKFGNASVIAGARSDTTMLLHIAPGHKRAEIISFPRDSMVPILACQADKANGVSGQQAQPGGLERLNSTFAYGGPVCLWKTLEQLTNIRIQHFVEVNFSGFQSIINDVGGVSVCLPYPINNPQSGLNLPAGLHTVSGTQALAFVRARENVGQGSDLQRIQRQQFFLDAVLQKLKKTNLLSDPARVLSVVTDTAKSLTTDSGLDLTTLLRIANSMKSLNSSAVDFLSVPVEDYPPDPTAEVQWVQPQSDQLFKAIASDKTLPKPAAKKAAAAPSAAPTVSPSQVQVDVLNGVGTSGLASTTATDLTNAGFTVIGSGDAATFGYTSNVIEYGSSSQLPEVNTLKAAVGSAQVKQDSTLQAGTINLIVGSNFKGLANAQASLSPSPSRSSAASNLTKTYGGITGSTNICKDAAAFAP